MKRHPLGLVDAITFVLLFFLVVFLAPRSHRLQPLLSPTPARPASRYPELVPDELATAPVQDQVAASFGTPDTSSCRLAASYLTSTLFRQILGRIERLAGAPHVIASPAE